MSSSVTGQVDWVSLLKTPITFGLGVLLRLSKAGLDASTVAFGRQKRIHDAFSHLDSFSSYGKLIWFGFGIKPIINDLADTEAGMTCVALCACMSISYDSFYAAGVIREFCKIYGAPPDFLPSIHQWKALVDICAGSISNSKFPTLLEGFIRCVLPNAELSLQKPTSMEALAKAVGALADVSNGTLENVIIAGGLDCMWLAAISEWLLSLNVEIRYSSGFTIYKSSTDSDYRMPAVIIIFLSDNDQPIHLSKCYIVPKGNKFWDNPSQGQHAFRGGRSEWRTILADTFGPCLHTLVQGSTRQEFALLMHHISHLTEAYYRYGSVRGDAGQNFANSSGLFSRFHFAHRSSRGHDFLTFAAQQLPELTATLDAVSQLEIRSHINPNLEDCINNIALKCVCRRCCGEMLVHNHRKSHVTENYPKERRRWVYDLPAYLPEIDVDILTAALIIFSGSEDTDFVEDTASSAVSRDGVCAFFKAMEDLDLFPEEASTVKVVPGYIEFNRIKYVRICDLIGDTGITRGDFGPRPAYKLLAQESRQPGVIAAAYKVSCNISSYEHVLGISTLEKAIAKSLRGRVRCRELCGRKFSNEVQEDIVFVQNDLIQEDNLSELSEGPLPFQRQWSVLSIQNQGMDKTIRLRIAQAVIYRLYFEIAKQDHNYHLAFLDVCRDCNSIGPIPPVSGKVDVSMSSHLDLSSNCRSEGTISVSSPSETGSWTNRDIEIFVITRSNLNRQETSATVTQNAMQLLPKHNIYYKGFYNGIHIAAMLGYEGMLQLMLEGGATMHSTMVGGETALHCAAKRGQYETVKILLGRGFPLEMKDKNGLTPLSSTARRGVTPMVEFLIRYDATLTSRDNYGKTTLVWAADRGHLALVERLLQEKADFNAAAGSSGRTSLQAAARGGHLAVVERLLQEKADRLLQEKADVNAAAEEYGGRTALQEAVSRGYQTIVDRLREAGARK
ncbi:putative ankyrin repeat-containing protein [Lojkania enalia]|uniref:Ankyrin repeat-containing protein n=1 Tax=Lojkania enalia TaxID=147567 RepID=A0A9P4KDF1_9PLEO|nr:putative ankyrin repeat-containing protein [Didymosphaeria enalia]